MSFPTRERGLKLNEAEAFVLSYTVVPHARTWIEIIALSKLLIFFASFPTRERGLKFCSRSLPRTGHTSFPTRERGLKYVKHVLYVVLTSRSPRGNVD